jgi:hypothetical protein
MRQPDAIANVESLVDDHPHAAGHGEQGGRRQHEKKGAERGVQAMGADEGNEATQGAKVANVLTAPGIDAEGVLHQCAQAGAPTVRHSGYARFLHRHFVSSFAG